MARRLNPRRSKIHRCYTVEEVARLYGLHRNTVRAWLRAGLEAIDRGRPLLIHGRDLRDFLERRRERTRCPCPVGTLYCFRCRSAQRPALGMVDYLAGPGRAGNVTALCESCGTAMYRRMRFADLPLKLPGFKVQVVEASSRLKDCTDPSLNCDSPKD